MLGIWKDKSNQTSLALASYYKGHGAIKKDKEKLDPKTQLYVNDVLYNYSLINEIRKKIDAIR